MADLRLCEIQGSILDKLIGEVSTFLDELANGTASYRTIQSLTQQIEHQYHERFVIELLQNAHDVLGKGDDKRRSVELKVSREGGPHGALYVANDGLPFQRENFIALARLGQSSKNPDDSVGNKGIGFRSVLEITDAPEIYSCRSTVAGELDGYCFRFSPDVLESLRAPIQELLRGTDRPVWTLGKERYNLDVLKGARIRARYQDREDEVLAELALLSPYVLPIPAKPTDALIRSYAKRQFATVVKLPFSNEEARSKTVRLLGDIDAETVLFLRRLKSLTVDDGDRCWTIGRRSAKLEGGRTRVSITDTRITSAERRFWFWSRKIGGTQDEAGAAALRKAAAGLPGKWPQISQAELSVAVELSDTPREGTYFIYLPTKLKTGIGAHVNAPFFGDMARTAIDAGSELNQMFLKNIKRLIADAVAELEGKGADEARAIVDLIAPVKGPGASWLEDLLEMRALMQRKLVLTDRGWTALREARILKAPESPRVLTADRLRQSATFPVIHERLSSRVGRIRLLAEKLDQKLEPTDEELAGTVSTVAGMLKQDSESLWEVFWHEVQTLLPWKASALRRHKVLLDSDGELRASEGSEATKVFFPSAAEGEEEARVDVKVIPPALKSRIAFLSDRIPLRVRRENRIEKSRARKYLEDLVEEFRVEAIFEKVLLPAQPSTVAKLDSGEGALCGEILSWAAKLVGGARSDATLVEHLSKLRLPCLGGWFPAQETAYGPGWPNTMGGAYRALLDAVGSPWATRERDRLLLPPEHPAWRDSLPVLRDRLPRMRVVDGFRPCVPPAWNGWFEAIHHSASSFSAGPPEVPKPHWQAYCNEVLGRIYTAFDKRSTYALRDVRVLIGLDDLDRMAPEGRRAFMEVLIGSIARWGDSWRRSSANRIEGSSDDHGIQSYLHFALARFPWLWIEENGSGRPARVTEHWYVPAILEPSRRHQYDHLSPLPLAVVGLIARSSAAPPLRELGMPLHDPETPTSSPALLVALARALRSGSVENAHRDVFTGQARDAWSVFQPGPATPLPTTLVVTRGGRAVEAIEPTAEDPVYLPTPAARMAPVGPGAALAVLVITATDGERLRTVFQKQLGEAVQLLASLELVAWAGDAAWHRSANAEPLDASVFRWLLPFTLTVAAFSGMTAWGVQTKSFQAAFASLRTVFIERVDGLCVRMLRKGRVEDASHRASSFWDPVTNTLLYDGGAADWLESMAPSLQRILRRTDLETPLRFALSKIKIGPLEEPSPDQQAEALLSLGISVAHLNEVQKFCVGSLSWIVDRLRPVVTMLAPRLNRSVLDGADSQERLLAALGTDLGGVDTASLILAAQEASGDRAMGQWLYERLGASADLGAWNRALATLGSPHKTLSNERCQEEVENHLLELRRPLRAIARYVAKHHATERYPAILRVIENPVLPEDLPGRYWSVPFSLIAAAVAQVLSSLCAERDLIDAVSGAADVEQLVERLEQANPAVEPRRDPSDIHALNRQRCGELMDQVRRAAVLWCSRYTCAPAVWMSPLEELMSPIHQELDSGAGFLELWSERDVLSAAARLSPRSAEQGPLFEAMETSVDLVSMLERIGLQRADLPKADEEVLKAQEVERRRQRGVNVCGHMFDSHASNLHQLPRLLERSLSETAIGSFDFAEDAGLRPVEAKRSGTWSPSKTGRKGGPPRLFEEKRLVVALAGEVIVYRRLCKTFGDAVNPSCWVSSLSLHQIPANIAHADDTLGYDFRVQKGKRTYFFEVKATVGEEDAFDLGSSEVRQAAKMANRKNQKYFIVHVKGALSPTPSIILLPNPYDDASRPLFRIEEAGQRVRYRSP